MRIQELINQLNEYDSDSIITVNLLNHSFHIERVDSFIQGHTEIILSSTQIPDPKCSWKNALLG